MKAETEERTRHTGRWVAVGIVGVIVLALLAAIGWYFLRVNPSLQQVETIETAFPEESLRPTEAATDGAAPINVLLLGSDSRAADGSLLTGLGDRADTILVAHIPPDRETMQLMSIMRDSWVEIPGHGMSKINAALSLGGVPLMVQTVEGVIDQRIDHIAIIDLYPEIRDRRPEGKIPETDGPRRNDWRVRIDGTRGGVRCIRHDHTRNS